jgi:hypothetical protein
MSMKRGGKTLICLLCIIALNPKLRAVSNDTPATPAPDDTQVSENSDGPYSAIWLRNVFDLKPEPPPPPPNEKTNLPPPNVELTGITTLLGTKRALFMVQEPASAGKPAGKEESYILTEGQRQGMLEVMEINPKSKMVTIKVEQQVSTITFKTNKVAIGPQGGVPAGAPGGGIPRPPMFNPAGFNPGGAGVPANVPIPTRMMRPTADNSQSYTPQGNQNAYNGYNPQSAGGYYGGGGVGGVPSVASTTPGLALPGFGSSAPAQNTLEAPVAAPPEVTAAIVNIQKNVADGQGVVFPPLPPPFQIPSSGSGGSSGTGGSTGGFGNITPPSLPPMPPLGSHSSGTLNH